MSDLKFWISDFRLKIPAFIFQISCFRCQVLGFRFQISDCRFHIPDFRVQIRDFTSQIPHFRRLRTAAGKMESPVFVIHLGGAIDIKNQYCNLWLPLTCRDDSGVAVLYITEKALVKLTNCVDAAEFEQLYTEGRLHLPFFASIKMVRRPSIPFIAA